MEAQFILDDAKKHSPMQSRSLDRNNSANSRLSVVTPSTMHHRDQSFLKKNGGAGTGVYAPNSLTRAGSNSNPGLRKSPERSSILYA
jgi:hypothetical protein